MGKPRVLSIDIETYSSLDLIDCGVYKYVESEDFDVVLFRNDQKDIFFCKRCLRIDKMQRASLPANSHDIQVHLAAKVEFDQIFSDPFGFWGHLYHVHVVIKFIEILEDR